jgi:hypothetical protein
MALLQDTLFIYGGQDPVTGLILSDLWAFNLQTLLWSSLTATKTSDSIGFEPPGLYKANMLFVDHDCEISVPSQSMNPQTGVVTLSDTTCGLLIYGGIGGRDLMTSLGQVLINEEFDSYTLIHMRNSLLLSHRSTESISIFVSLQPLILIILVKSCLSFWRYQQYRGNMQD